MPRPPVELLQHSSVHVHVHIHVHVGVHVVVVVVIVVVDVLHDVDHANGQGECGQEESEDEERSENRQFDDLTQRSDARGSAPTIEDLDVAIRTVRMQISLLIKLIYISFVTSIWDEINYITYEMPRELL